MGVNIVLTVLEGRHPQVSGAEPRLPTARFAVIPPVHDVSMANHEIGEKPGKGRYCCTNCSWSVVLDDDSDQTAYRHC